MTFSRGNELVPNAIMFPADAEKDISLLKNNRHFLISCYNKLLMFIPEHGLHIDYGFSVCHVVFLCTHSALLVHHHQVISVDDATLQ